jgi:hypothetical protein
MAPFPYSLYNNLFSSRWKPLLTVALFPHIVLLSASWLSLLTMVHSPHNGPLFSQSFPPHYGPFSSQRCLSSLWALLHLIVPFHHYFHSLHNGFLSHSSQWSPFFTMIFFQWSPLLTIAFSLQMAPFPHCGSLSSQRLPLLTMEPCPHSGSLFTKWNCLLTRSQSILNVLSNPNGPFSLQWPPLLTMNPCYHNSFCSS